MTRFRKLVIATTAATFALIGVGGLVRATGSGEGCPNWPGCSPGRLLPPIEYHALIEFSHRSLTAVVSVLVALVAGWALWRFRKMASILWPSVTAAVLLIAQAALGGFTVKHDLAPVLVTAHFAVAMLLAGTLVVLTANTFGSPRAQRRSPSRFAGLAAGTAVATYALLLVGAYVRGRGAGLAFPDWPLMNGKLVPQLGGIATTMFLHRILAAIVGLAVVYVALRAWTMRPRSAPIVALSSLALGLFVAQVFAGAALVWTELSAPAKVTHVLLSSLIWGSLVALAAVSRWTPAIQAVGMEEPAADRQSLRERAVAYFQLTKPRIIVLLLITTVPAMVLAKHGAPSVLLIGATLLGGTLAAGGANAFNCYLDRDIDEMMRRTRRRPLPSHRVTPESALGFGYVLGAVSFFWLGTTVNVLAAVLALSAILFYVLVYTLWLKRTTAQNIVIGGAAGAVPVLVGWAAVTGTLSWPAALMFAVVFMWTPPHFWALSMRYAKDYAEAGIPMLPVVKGPRETAWNVLVYSVALVGVTLVLWPVAGMGAIYLVAAVGLGALFVHRAWRLWQNAKPAVAMRLFRFSIVYLALLFAAIALDQLVYLSV